MIRGFSLVLPFMLFLTPAALPAQSLGNAGTGGRPSGAAGIAGELAGFSGVPGWIMEESIRVYEGPKLYELVNGGASLYLEYGFERAFAMVFERPEARLSVEVFEMTGSEGAYGIFSYLAAGSTTGSAPCGQEGKLGEGFIVFRKGRCAVTVTMLQGEAPDALPAFAAAVDRILPAGEKRPAVAQCLENRLSAVDVVYFRGPLGYQKRHGLPDAQLMRVQEGAAGLVENCDAVILLYPSPDSSRAVMSILVDSLAERGKGAAGMHAAEGALFRARGSFYSIRSAGRHLVLVRGPGREAVLRTARKIKM